MHSKANTKGNLDVVCGSMFSGKTEEVIRRLRRSIIAQQKTQIFKHSLDDRVTTESLHSHSGDKLSAIAVTTPEALFNMILPETQVVGIDEVQFFSHEIVYVIDELINQGKHVIAGGLDLDFRGIPFGPMPALLAIADSVTKLKAVCMVCGQDAHFTQRIVNGKPARFDDPIILVGAQECYQARCRRCYQIDKSHA